MTQDASTPTITRFRIDLPGHLSEAEGAAMLAALKAAVPAATVERRDMASPAVLQAARELFGTDDMQVDDDAEVSAPGGLPTHLWVSAWVRLGEIDVPLTRENARLALLENAMDPEDAEAHADAFLADLVREFGDGPVDANDMLERADDFDPEGSGA